MTDPKYKDVVTALADAFLDVQAAETGITRYRGILAEKEAALVVAKATVARLHSELVNLIYAGVL